MNHTLALSQFKVTVGLGGRLKGNIFFHWLGRVDREGPLAARVLIGQATFPNAASPHKSHGILKPLNNYSVWK